MADHHPWSRTVVSSGLFITVLGGVVANSVGTVSLSSCNKSVHDVYSSRTNDGQMAQASNLDGKYVQGEMPQDLSAPDTAHATSVVQFQGTVIAETANRPALIGVDSGSFWMGSNPQERGECQSCQDETLHRAHIGYPLYVAESEITQGQFESVLGRNPAPVEHLHPQKPVGNINLVDALEYCNKLSALEGLELCYSDLNNGPKLVNSLACKGYRIPTEAEWEYFARAGEWNLYAGSNEPDKVAWYNKDPDDGPELVKTKQPNAWKLYDLSGNLAEWVWDGHGPYIIGEPEVVNPLRTESSSENVALTVIRGGAWYDQAFRVRVANRQGYDFREIAEGHGFRIVRSNL